jgi:hypothetical protein
MNIWQKLRGPVGAALIVGILFGCSAPAATPTAAPITPLPTTATATPTNVPITPSPTTAATTPTPVSATPLPTEVHPTSLPTPTATTAPTQAPTVEGLSDEEAATLNSLAQVNDYPLYTMHYYGAYRQATEQSRAPEAPPSPPAWACSLFAALGDAENMLYGRNFDWDYSPTLLLFTDPPDGYASVSMVDVAYLGFEGSAANGLIDLSLVERQALLDAPFLPFDGMNEYGLAVGMAAVPDTQLPYDPNRQTLDSVMVIREILDHARNVDEAVNILQSYNVDMGGGPSLHYLVADASGRAALVEFYQGQVVVMPNETPWHLATNFLRTPAGESAQGRCWRYDEIDRRLTRAEGQMRSQEAMELLAQVSQDSTQWSVVYEMSSGQVNVVMGREYEVVHTFHLDLAGDLVHL